MVKGITRQAVVVRTPDPELFEQAIFIVRCEVRDGRRSLERQAHGAAQLAPDRRGGSRACMAADGAALSQRLRAGCSYPARGWERYKERAFAGAHCRRDGDHEKRMPPHILCGGISVRQNIRRIPLNAAE